MHGYYWDWGHGPFWGGGFIMIIFWICLIFIILFVLRKLFKGEHQSESALDILKKRYAAGEISKEEFEEMKKEVQS
jgi:putative membrane protein